MTRQALIDRTVRALQQLPKDKAAEVSDFADFLSKKYEEHQLSQGLHALTAESQTFAFLAHEEDLYTDADLKEVYHG